MSNTLLNMLPYRQYHNLRIAYLAKYSGTQS